MGAWIETFEKTSRYNYQSVAPYMGAWIETSGDLGGEDNELSHPTWVRGLKPGATL